MNKYLIYFDQYYGRNQYIQSFSIIVEANTTSEAKQIALDNINNVTKNDYARIEQNKGFISQKDVQLFRTPGATNIIKSIKRIKST